MPGGKGSDSLGKNAKAEIAALRKAAATSGWKIVDWQQVGQPPAPVMVSAAMRGGDDAALVGLVKRFAALERTKELRVFIRGVPADAYQVIAELQLGGPDTIIG
jgi:hypothetical protein